MPCRKGKRHDCVPSGLDGKHADRNGHEQLERNGLRQQRRKDAGIDHNRLRIADLGEKGRHEAAADGTMPSTHV
jgi:hypothetical protein